MSRRTLIGIVAAVVVVAVAVMLIGGCPKKNAGEAAAPEAQTEVAAGTRRTPVSVVTAVRGPIREAIRVTGTVAALREVDVVPEGGGRVRGVYADIGDRVSKGALLLSMDTDILGAQSRQAQAALDIAKARLKQAKDTTSLTDDTTGISVAQAEKNVDLARTQLQKAETGAATTETRVNNGIQQARIGVQSAETQLADVRRGSRRQQIAQAKSAVEMAQAQYDFTKSQYEIKKRLYTQGAASGTEFGEALAQFESARSQLDQAKAQLDLVEEGPTAEQVGLAELQVEQANEQLRLAEAQRDDIALAREDVALARTQLQLAEDQLDMARAGKGEVVVRESDVDAAVAGVRQAAASADLADLMIGKNRVYSPLSGLVTMRFADPGEQAGNQDPVFRIVDISKVYVEAVLGERDVAQVHEGQSATVTVKGLAGAEFEGHVVDINPASIPGQRNFTARVLVDNEGDMLRPGMSAEVALVVSETAAAVLLQRDAVVEDREKRLVYVVLGDAVEVREVDLGADERGRVEILSGVDVGELVVVAGQASLADGERVEPIQRESGL